MVTVNIQLMKGIRPEWRHIFQHDGALSNNVHHKSLADESAMLLKD